MSERDSAAPGTERFASVFVACRAVLVRAVSRIVRRHDVEDILQEAFVRSFEAAGKTTIRNPRAFLLRTATNLALNHVARAGYRTTDDIEALSESQVYQLAKPSAESEADADERFHVFCRAVGALPPQCRQVFILKKVYGLSQQEIAAHLALSQSTVEKHIAKGLLLCREQMESAGVEAGTGRRSA